MKILESSLIWYLKVFGIPLAVGASMYGICRKFSDKKRRNVLGGKVVVITGASSGIGEALAHYFYEYGSKVVLAARRESELNRVKQSLMSKKVVETTEEPTVISLDLANPESIDAFVQKVYQIHGVIDILINNGGISHRASILQTKLEVYKQIMDVNYFGSVQLTKAALPNMVEKKSGHIVFVSSVQGLISLPDRSAYGASKHAMQAFGDSLRAEIHQHNIKVCMVSPGYVKTAISLNALTGTGEAHAIMDKSTAEGFSPEYCADKIIDAVVNNKNDLVVSQFMPKVGIFMRHFWPSFYHWVMSRRANRTT